MSHPIERVQIERNLTEESVVKKAKLLNRFHPINPDFSSLIEFFVFALLWRSTNKPFADLRREEIV